MIDPITHIIGQAPSELSPQELRIKLEQERVRVREALTYFRETHNLKPTKTTKKKAKSISKLLKESGLSKEQFLKGLALLKKGEKTDGGK